MAAGTHTYTEKYFLLEHVSDISFDVERGDRFASFQITHNLSIVEGTYELLLEVVGSK